MITSSSLIKWHFAAACAHSIAFAVSFGLTMASEDPITVNGIPVAFWMPAFAGITTLFELAAATPVEIHTRLDRGAAPLRWIEYSITASIMLVAIAQLSTVDDPRLLILAIVLPNVACQYTGYKLELTGKKHWFWIGSLLGIVPWIPISVAFFQHVNEVPGFVLGIYVSLIALFLPFPYVAWRYSSGSIHFIQADLEYTFWSLTAKMALLGQVLAGALTR